MPQPRRIERVLGDPASGPPADQPHVVGRRLSSAEQMYLRSVIDLVEATASRLAVPGDAIPALGDVWVERSIVALDRGAVTAPTDDQDSPGEGIGVLTSGAPGSARFLVGAGGSGKTSAIRYVGARLAIELLAGAGELFPLYVNASNLMRQPRGDLVEVLAAAAAESVSAASITPSVLHDVLNESEVPLVIFIDGLEVTALGEDATPHEQAAAALLRGFRGAMPSSRVVATCREEVWFDPAFGLRHLGDAFHLRLFSMRNIAEAIDNWLKVRGDGRLSGAALVRQIAADRHLSQLCRLPLMLALTLFVVERRGHLPEGVGGLCEELTQACLDAVEDSGDDRVARRVDHRVELRQVLQVLAWRLTKPRALGESKSEATEILTAAQVRDAVVEVLDTGGRSAAVRASAAAIDFLNLFHAGIGIFGETIPNGYGFYQDAFRLFFAGHHIARAPDEPTQVLCSTAGSQALLIWAQGRAYRQEVDSVLVIVEELFEEGVVAEMLVAAELLAAVIKPASESRPRWVRRWHPRVRVAMADLRASRECPLAQRMRAGDVLADLGDPLVVSEEYQGENFVTVTGGLVTVGRAAPPAASDRKYDRIHWSPQYSTTLSGYRIARFPVTNADYRRFIEAGGYDRLEHWTTPEAKRWREGDEGFADELARVVSDSLGVHYTKDIEGQFMTVLDYTDLRNEFLHNLLRRDRPLYWWDARFNRANQPVVGVNWWEASAFCTWLTSELRRNSTITSKQVCRLPTEEEWEHAAAPPGSAFPWGADWKDDMAHVRQDEGWIARSVAIGAFPWSDSPTGMACAVGNVWEWCLSPADEYTARPSISPEGGLGDRVTRGSSWLAKEPLTRDVAFRSYDPPCNAYVDLGLRVVVGDPL
jgi:formylglycine-generating enzyme required for sulfatase activity